MPTFMAKPYGDQPGCSGHIHISLKDKDGRNIFAVKEEEVEKGREGAQYEDTKRISQEAEWFLAGVLEGLPDIVRALSPCGSGKSLTHLVADALFGPDRQRVSSACSFACRSFAD
jgi:glutamine synthetase